MSEVVPPDSLLNVGLATKMLNCPEGRKQDVLESESDDIKIMQWQI